MKKLTTLLLLTLLPLMASAYDAQVDGIYYNLITEAKQAEVTSGDTKYTGNVTIPESFTYNGVTYSVTSIEDFAFYNCSGLTSVTIPNSVTSIGKWAFHGCSALTSINIPDGVTSIGTETFRRCTNLASIVIPDNVTSIGGEAFYECSSLTSLLIGSGIETISNSFKKCPNLTEVYCNAKNVPNTSNRAFLDSQVGKATLYVPATSLEAYKATEPWSGFGTIEAIQDGGLRGDVNGDGEVNVGDLVCVSNYMAGDDSVSKDAADVNQDGEVNVGDMVVISNIMSGNE